MNTIRWSAFPPFLVDLVNKYITKRKARPSLIIGHVGCNQARIWVRGSDEYPVAFLEYEQGKGGASQKAGPLLLEERHDYTGIFELDQLVPLTHYQCKVAFAKQENGVPTTQNWSGSNTGTFQTAPPDGEATDVCFLLGSCNLHSLGPVSSPDKAFERIAELTKTEGVNFMIHCGDQIYFDLPIPTTPFISVDIEQYRSKYVDAWGDSRPTNEVLRMMPHYMILDDHEIINDFANDKEIFGGLVDLDRIKDVAIKAYREYQHLKNPQTYGHDVLYYNFSYGQARFFVMDVRTERYQKTAPTQMINQSQLERFLVWLKEFPDEVKFVVSSVPFVAELKYYNDDKWCGTPFLAQREEIIKFIAQNNILNVTFLTGDMHHSYHALMEITTTDQKKIVLHELMSSPINQLGKNSFDVYQTPTQPKPIENSQISYSSFIEPDKFYRKHSNVMCIRVSKGQLHYELFRTKSQKSTGIEGSFSVKQ